MEKPKKFNAVVVNNKNLEDIIKIGEVFEIEDVIEDIFNRKHYLIISKRFLSTGQSFLPSKCFRKMKG